MKKYKFWNYIVLNKIKILKINKNSSYRLYYTYYYTYKIVDNSKKNLKNENLYHKLLL